MVSAAWPLAGFAQSATEHGDPVAVAAIEQTLIDVIARAERSVVAIARTSPTEASSLQPRADEIFGGFRLQLEAVEQPNVVAAGVIIDPAGLILTEYLAVHADEAHTVTTIDGKTYPATVKAADPRSGLAVLALRNGGPGENSPAVPSSLPAIRIGDASQLRKGQFVIAIGNPYAIRSDGEPTASWGTVANLARKAPAHANLNDVPGPNGDYRTTLHHLGTLIQTDAKLGWNAGGGALVNLRGELVGLTTTVATIAGHEQPAGYAIAIDNTMRRVIETLEQGREVEYGLLGVSFRGRQLGAADGSGNVPAVIAQVFPGSPAARAGLEANDIVTRVAGKPVTDVDQVQLAISILPPSESVSIAYQRDGRANQTSAVLAKLGVPGKMIVTEKPPSWRGLRVDYATAFDAPTLSERLTTGAIDSQGCVAVAEVEPDSPAWQAGIRPGMFISHVGPERVTSPQEFAAAVKNLDEMANIRLTQPIRPSRPTEGNQQQVQIPAAN